MRLSYTPPFGAFSSDEEHSAAFAEQRPFLTIA